MEKIRWRAKFDALTVEHEQCKKELSEAVSNGLNLAKENDELREQIAQLKKDAERARVQGMHDACGLILRSDQP